MPIAIKFSYLMFFSEKKARHLFTKIMRWLQHCRKLYMLLVVITKLKMFSTWSALELHMLLAQNMFWALTSSRLSAKLITTSLIPTCTCRCHWSSISSRSRYWWTTSAVMCCRWKLNQISYVDVARDWLSICNISARSVFQKLGNLVSLFAISYWPLSMLFISAMSVSASSSASLNIVKPVEKTSHFSGLKSPEPD